VRLLRIALAWLAATGITAVANDTAATWGAGGLIPLKSSTIVMDSEDLEISIHQVTVKYEFRNPSDHDVTATVAFPLPEVDGGDLWNEPVKLPTNAGINFMQFRVLINGRPVMTHVETRAYQHGRDITAMIRQLGLPVSVVAAFRHPNAFTAAALKLPLKVRQHLVDQGLLDCDADAGKGTCVPYWSTRIQFFWTQRFPAHSSVAVEHQYQPIVGGSYITTNYDGATSVRPYCGGQRALAAIKRLRRRMPPAADGTVQFWERRIRYILTTANNWNGPIRKFHLSVLADTPDDIVLTCMPGLKRLGPTRYAMALANFHPRHNLDVLILQVNQDAR